MNALALGRCIVVGAGAVGAMFARLLTRSGADVLVVDRTPASPTPPRSPRSCGAMSPTSTRSSPVS